MAWILLMIAGLLEDDSLHAALRHGIRPGRGRGRPQADPCLVRHSDPDGHSKHSTAVAPEAVLLCDEMGRRGSSSRYHSDGYAVDHRVARYLVHQVARR